MHNIDNDGMGIPRFVYHRSSITRFKLSKKAKFAILHADYDFFAHGSGSDYDARATPLHNDM